MLLLCPLQETTNKLDEPLPIPRPIAQGWMRKRADISTGWKRRYFVLFPDFDYGGITLFYYVNQQVRAMCVLFYWRIVV